MPVYRYKCKCGATQDQFLTQDKDSVVLVCQACGKGVTARQVRDKTAVVNTNSEVHGVFRRDNADQR